MIQVYKYNTLKAQVCLCKEIKCENHDLLPLLNTVQCV